MAVAFLPLGLAGGATQGATHKAVGSQQNQKTLYSIVLITLDTVRADRLGCYGYARAETPALDGLARDAVRFQNAYTVVPITLPSHVVMLTGTYPMWNGVRDFTSPGLPAGVPTLAEALKHNGYATAAFVSAFVLNSMWGLNRGFDVYDDEMKPRSAPGNDLFLVTRSGDRTTDRMLAWLAGNGQRPFFVWLHLYDAHSPYRSPEPFRSRHAGRPYDGAIAFDDAHVGRVLAGLRGLGLYDRTLIIVTADHGESLGEHGEAEHGFFIYNATLRIPLLVKWPGASGRGRVVPQPVSNIDLAPTIAQVAGLSASATKDFQGRPLSRWIGPQQAPFEPLYAQSYYARDSFGWHELQACITENFKYIDAPEPELYDLRRDPDERSNVIATHQAEAASLRTTLESSERRFSVGTIEKKNALADPEAIEKLRSLGYVAYQALSNSGKSPTTPLPDPKLKIESFNKILRAGDLRRAGKYAEAAQLLGELRRSEPKLYVLPFEAGENYLAWGKPQEAIKEFRAALQLNPSFDQTLLGLGRAYFQVGDDSNATTALRMALTLNPRDFLARLALAKVYYRSKSWQSAETELARVAAEQPQFAEGHADYGVLLVRAKKYSEGEWEIKRGIELGYRDANTFTSLGIARDQLNQPGPAIQAYQQALELDPHFVGALLNLALDYKHIGQAREAQSYYQKLCESSARLCQEYRAQFSTP